MGNQCCGVKKDDGKCTNNKFRKFDCMSGLILTIKLFFNSVNIIRQNVTQGKEE